MRTSKLRHLHQAGSQKTEQRNEKSACASLRRHCVWHCRAAAVWWNLLLLHMDVRCFTDQEPVCQYQCQYQCQKIATPFCAGGHHSWCTHPLEVQYRSPRCQKDSFPAISVPHRPTSDSQQKCATVWNFSCGWYKNRKNITSFHSRPLPPLQQLLTSQPQTYAQHKGLGWCWLNTCF